MNRHLWKDTVCLKHPPDKQKHKMQFKIICEIFDFRLLTLRYVKSCLCNIARFSNLAEWTVVQMHPQTTAHLISTLSNFIIINLSTNNHFNLCINTLVILK